MIETAAPKPIHILVVDDEADIRRTLSSCPESEGHSVIGVSNFDDAVHEASRRSFGLALVDLRLGTADGLDLIPVLLAQTPWLKVIVITAYASIDTAVKAMRRGATDYIPKPFTPAQVKLAVRKVFELRALEQKVASLQEDLGRSNPEVDFTSGSPAMQRVISLLRQVAPTEATVLLRGESGTGKWNLLSSDSSPRLGDKVSLQEIEEEHIRQVLAYTKSLQEAADILGIDQATLWRRRKKYGI